MIIEISTIGQKLPMLQRSFEVRRSETVLKL